MKRSTIITIVAMLVIAVIATVIVLLNRTNPVDEIAAEIRDHNGEAPAVTQTLATRVPENAFFVASATNQENMNEWWNFFSRLDYRETPLPASLNGELTPDEILYASFPYEGEDGARVSSALYVRIDGEAEAFQDWLIEERFKMIEGAEEDPLVAMENSQPIIAHDDFLIIPSDAFSYNELISYVYDETGEPVTVEGLTANDQWSDISNINNAMMWVDMESYFDFYYNMGPENAKEPVHKILVATTGYQPDTTFLGTSKDGGQTWSGIFPTGGLDTSAVDLSLAEQLINGSIVISEGPAGVRVEEGFLEFASVISASSKIDEEGNIQTFGEVRPPQTDTPVTALAAVEDEFRTSVVFSPQRWAALYEGMSRPASLSHVTLDITENNSARLSFSFYDDAAEESDS